MKKYWKDTYDYKRILEILDDYWLTEPDELIVRVQMDFLKADGKSQQKCIWWLNPNYHPLHEKSISQIPSVSALSEIDDLPDPFDGIDVRNYVKG